MTKEEQLRTGVSRLTASERKALEEWTHTWTLKTMRYAQKSTTTTVPATRTGCPHTGRGHWVSSTIDSGEFVKLEDDSLWQISPLDRINTMLWLVTEDITIVASGNAAYPCKLVNKDSEDSAEAKRVK